MNANENKVQFGLEKLYYALITVTNGEETFGTPKAVPGAVSLSMDAETGETTFYADNIKYYVSKTNNGYSGSVELAKVPEEMWEDVYGVTVDATDKVMVEKTTDVIKEVALLFEFSGDKNKNNCVLYRCVLGRPSISHQTTEDSNEPQTVSIDYEALPLSDGKVRATTTSQTDATVKSDWYTSVYTG